MKASVRSRWEQEIEKVIPKDAASDFNQGLIELGAIVCVPNGAPKCEECPLSALCQAKAKGCQERLPVKKKAKERRIEERTVFIFKDNHMVAIRKRPSKGLLAGLYEFPNVVGHLSVEEAAAYGKSIGLMPVRVQKLGSAKHIFSHVEWHMRGYIVRCREKLPGYVWVTRAEREALAMPTAFRYYRKKLEEMGY